MALKEDYDNAEYFQVKDGKAPFLVDSQKLDHEFWELLSRVASGESESFDIVNRVQMAINLFRIGGQDSR